MSAESTLVFYGIRFEISTEDLEALETNSHPLIKKARSSGLQFYGGNFAEPDEKYYLFVGLKFGVLGAENADEVTITDGEFATAVQKTRERLAASTFDGEPRLYIQRMPDAS